ncbi:ABC transporter ATP-binding protein [Anaerocolumna jejuensis]|uniref:ABC transporter ATP-binding protein n=1 Tax=Anaerocolumna jejuensis TaxID=259063 RepID=UPI003F7BC668
MEILMEQIMVDIKDVSRSFRMANDKVNSLKEFFVAKLEGRLTYNEFWALKNVSFQVFKGETVGIIGRNGSGKSTLLKVISGIMKPTSGAISVNGNVAPMLELGSGFDLEMTGRENIFLNGAILGYKEEFLQNKFNEIVEFSELKEFIDVRIRNYSSGMLMRLAFSIATLVNPEILIVDEILSVGDSEFKRKSQERMEQMMSGGTTVFLVSHDINQVRAMCSKVVWLDQGQVKMVGRSQEVCDAYEGDTR